MKTFILRVGQPLIGISVVIGIIASVVMGLAQGYTVQSFGGNNIGGVLTFCLMTVVGIAGVIIASFLIYLLIDIRDELKSISNRNEPLA